MQQVVEDKHRIQWRIVSHGRKSHHRSTVRQGLFLGDWGVIPGHGRELFDKGSVKHGGGKTTELLCNKL